MVNRLTGGLIILLFLGLLTFLSGLVPYGVSLVSVDDVLEGRNQGTGKLVVQGIVKSLYHEKKDGTLRFQLKSEVGREMQVVYSGPAPKDLTGGGKVSVRGRFTVEQVFVAEKIWTKPDYKQGER
ncbi:MAG: cytochrome c maturation protein CcmE domain-containing protein [Thermincolia bacterium]